MLRQRTLRERVTCTGIGLHSGRPIHVEILPAAVDSGITFVRSDLPGHCEIKACADNLADTTLATTLAAGVNGTRASVATVEHALAALTGLGVDNARVLVDGPEMPALDGSAAGFVDMLQRAGLLAQRAAKRFIAIKREVCVKDGLKSALVRPSPELRIDCTVDFDHPLIPPTPYRFQYCERAFVRDISRARTFGFLRDAESLQARGLARGVSLDNTVVIDQYRVLNPDGLRYPDEFVRHKVLDAMGDLSLLGLPLVGLVELHRSGHALNTRLARAVLSDARNYAIVAASAADPIQESVIQPMAFFEQVESVA